MKIDRVRLTQLEGVLDHADPFWEERLVRPMDIYPEHKAEGAHWTPMDGPGRYRIEAVFVEVGTDAGETGLGGPITLDQGAIISRQMSSMVVGEDPWASERIWDKIYRSQVHGRGGAAMMALSALDCALWDLKG